LSEKSESSLGFVIEREVTARLERTEKGQQF